MNTASALLVLFIAALLEAGGDALIRSGLHASALKKTAFMVLGGLVLFCYGYTVNAPTWDFGRLLGIYVVFFFLVAQAINLLAFGQQPTPGILVGGSLIVLGGLAISFMRS
jgi:hypothetical protein